MRPQNSIGQYILQTLKTDTPHIPEYEYEYDGMHSHSEEMLDENKLASLEAILVQNNDPPTKSPTRQLRV